MDLVDNRDLLSQYLIGVEASNKMIGCYRCRTFQRNDWSHESIEAMLFASQIL